MGLSAVRFQTEFDTARRAYPVPLILTSGRHPALAVVDGFLRGEAIVGRFESAPGLIGIAVHSARRPVDVTLTITADARTPEFNDRGRAAGAPRPHQPRLLLVRSQGRTRAAVLLTRAPTEFGFRTGATVLFRVDGAEISEDGLFVVELANSALDPELGIAPYAASGVRIDAVRIALAPDEQAAPPPVRTAPGLVAAGLVGTGLPVRRDRAHLGSGLFTVAPSEVTCWRLRARRVRPVRPDRARPAPGAPWPRETPATQLRMRQKFVLLARFRARQIRQSLLRRACHVLARAARAADPPLGWLAAVRVGRDVRRGQLTAEVLPLEGASPVPCTLRHAGGRDIEVSIAGPLGDHAAIRLAAPPPRRATSFRYAWRLLDGGSP